MTDDSTGPISLTAADGAVLAGDLARSAAPRAAAVLCHPHPAYGGDRHNMVVDALFRALPPTGVAALRFDFRGAGGGEQDDVLAALDRLAAEVPGVPLWLVGYSFGADVALGVDDPRAAGWVAVAPPLRFGGTPAPARGDPRPALVLLAGAAGSVAATVTAWLA